MFRIAFLALLTGCATSTAMYTPDGRQGYAISCGGEYVWNADSWQACYEKASQLCGEQGYDIYSRDQELVSGEQREMLIACGSPATP